MDHAEPSRAGRREWLGLAMLALPTLLVSMDLTVLHLAVPQISADLRPSSSQILWITDVYGFLIAGFLVPMGSLGDRIGRRRLLLIGSVAFGLASVVAALASNAEALIAARALLGVAGATLMPSTMALIRNMFHDDAQRSQAIGLWVMSFMVGAAIGPLVGGALLEHFWWGSVFLLAVPVMALLVVAGPLLLPEFRDTTVGRVDLASVVLSLVAILALVYGMKRFAEVGIAWQPLVAALGGVAAGVLFVMRQAALSDPLVDLGLFRSPRFSVALGALMLQTFVTMGFNLYIAQYLQLVLGFSPLVAGLWTLPMTVAGIVAITVTTRLTGWLSPATIMAAGLVVGAGGFLLFSLVEAGNGLALVVAGSVVMFAGLATMGVLSTDMVVSTAPVRRAGAASALAETGNELGGALGLAVLGTIGSTVYRQRVAVDAPAGVPAEAAGRARETLGGALDEAVRLPADAATALVDAARSAFTAGLQTVALVCAVVVVMTAALTAVLLRDGRSSRADDEAIAKEVDDSWASRR